LGVKMAIVGVPSTANGWELTWLGDRAGYLDGTAYPTWSGNTGITGHVYLPNGKPGPFVNLHTMVWGQQVIVHLDGQKYIYEVRSVRRVWPDDITVLGHAELPTLTLITCQGYNEAASDYRYRIAVRAVLIKIEPEGGSSAGAH
jgi:LPXTG-site transpeptidase (sortase) family protein